MKNKIVQITKEYVDQRDGYRYLMLKGLCTLIQSDTFVYGLFERVKGGVLYSAPDDEHFDDMFTDDVNHVVMYGVR